MINLTFLMTNLNEKVLFYNLDVLMRWKIILCIYIAVKVTPGDGD